VLRQIARRAAMGDDECLLLPLTQDESMSAVLARRSCPACHLRENR
jgi:hypothetical protein